MEPSPNDVGNWSSAPHIYYSYLPQFPQKPLLARHQEINFHFTNKYNTSSSNQQIFFRQKAKYPPSKGENGNVNSKTVMKIFGRPIFVSDFVPTEPYGNGNRLK